MDGIPTNGAGHEQQSWRRPLRRIPIGPVIVIFGLFLPTVSLTSCDAFESSASGIALIAAPLDEALPEESGPFDGPTRVPQVVTALILMIALVTALTQVLMRRKVLSSALIVVLGVLGIAALPVLDWSLELAVTRYNVEPSVGMVTIAAGFGFAGISAWYWLLSDHDRPHPEGHLVAGVLAGMATFGAMLNMPIGWPIGLAPFLAGVITAQIIETAWLVIWTILLLANRLRSTTVT